MIIKLLFSFSFLSFFAACNNTNDANKRDNSLVFMGSFSGEPIRIILTEINDTLIKGTSDHKGVMSNMEGHKKASEKGFFYELAETGTSNFEGVFRFELDTATNKITGVWSPIDTQKKFVVQYTLSKVDCSCHK